MKHVVFSDVHSNLEALSSVLDDIKSRNLEKAKKICLGDIVGYGPNPNECIDIVLDAVGENVVIGNHDRSVAWRIVGDARYLAEQFIMNQYAEWVLSWTAKNLNDKNKQRLVELVKSDKYIMGEENLIFTHSTPIEPGRMDYIESSYDATMYFFGDKKFKGKIAFAGHIHKPQLYHYNNETTRIDISKEMPLGKQNERMSKKFSLANSESSLIVVPGLGQPRDKNNKTGYVIYDSDSKTLEIIRLPYDFKQTQEKMVGADFPELLIERLALGR